MPTRKELISQAITWIDVPAIASGSQRVGCNCLGLHVGYLRELGEFEEMVEEAEKHVGFRKPITPSDLLKRLVESKHLHSIRPYKFSPGNLMLFFTRDGPQHLTLITESGIILHSSQKEKKVVQHLIPDGWRAAAEFQLVGLSD